MAFSIAKLSKLDYFCHRFVSLNFGSKGIDLKHIGALQFSFSADSLFVLCQMREKGYFEHFDEIQA